MENRAFRVIHGTTTYINKNLFFLLLLVEDKGPLELT